MSEQTPCEVHLYGMQDGSADVCAYWMLAAKTAREGGGS